MILNNVANKLNLPQFMNIFYDPEPKLCKVKTIH